MRTAPLFAYNGEIRLAGSLWLPPGRAAAGLVLMHPGSGPSDRDNDTLFPPIRAALLDAGVAVCSFDKRGVGESAGSWLDAPIAAQADDLAVSLRAAREQVPDVRAGIFGHSQGGWVVLEAATRAGADFVVTNSGPAVSPRAQEASSTANRLRGLNWPDEKVRDGEAVFAELMELLSSGVPFDVARAWLRRTPLAAELIAAGVFVPDSEPLWMLAAALVDYDPRPALERLDVPLLALLGERDTVVPVEQSAAVFRAAVRPDLLELRIIAGGDHRLQSGDEFAPGYLDTLTTFVTHHLP